MKRKTAARFGQMTADEETIHSRLLRHCGQGDFRYPNRNAVFDETRADLPGMTVRELGFVLRWPEAQLEAVVLSLVKRGAAKPGAVKLRPFFQWDPDSNTLRRSSEKLQAYLPVAFAGMRRS